MEYSLKNDKSLIKGHEFALEFNLVAKSHVQFLIVSHKRNQSTC